MYLTYFNPQRFRIIVKSRFSELFEELNDQKENSKSTNKIKLVKEYKITYPIIIEDIKSGVNIKTTVIIKNIDHNITIDQLIALLNKKNIKNYDFIYFPIHLSLNQNFGFAIINFKSPKDIITFYHKFHKKNGNIQNSYFKLYYSYIQGNSLKKMCNSKFLYFYDESNFTQKNN